MWPHKASTLSPTLCAADVTGATREVVRQLGHAVSVPRRDVEDAVPTAPAIDARQAAWKRCPHASAATPPSRASRHIEHWSAMLNRPCAAP